jgi:glyoxylase-like metal-dependent hydrolase (beta-lactamase superfamily II)
MTETDKGLNVVFPKRVDNVYVIDTNMFGFEHFSSSYIIEGREIVLIDTGFPKQIDAVRAGIKEHGFSIGDISRIFVTHCEHADHSGNVGTFVQENPKIKVHINPKGLEYLTDPANSMTIPPRMAAEFFGQVPVPRSRIELLSDGDVFDIGNGEKLSITFTSGHQLGGLVIYEEKNKGLFSGDVVGDYFKDADFLQVLSPAGSDVLKAMETIKKFMTMPINRLYLGHFGIVENPKELMQRSLNGFQNLLDIAAKCIEEGKPEEIEARVYASKLPEVEKLRKTRGETVYEFTRNGSTVGYSKNFAKYYLDLIRDK